MKLSFLIFILSFNSFAGSMGMWPSNDNVEANYEYYYQVNKSHIQDFILESNKNISTTTAMSYSDYISEAASCFEIDKMYLTSLIKKESMFVAKAKSHTGAAGLTQITGIAIKEVKDQLGLRGSGYARKSNITYFKGQKERCLGEDYEGYLKAISTGPNTFKAKLMNNPRLSIFTGALILNIYLANAAGKCSKCNIKTLYRKALEQYNGDTHKVSYAKKIQVYIDDYLATKKLH